MHIVILEPQLASKSSNFQTDEVRGRRLLISILRQFQFGRVPNISFHHMGGSLGSSFRNAFSIDCTSYGGLDRSFGRIMRKRKDSAGRGTRASRLLRSGI
jgi:hypothetical protein